MARAVRIRPKLKDTPAPVERTGVGNSSGKNSGKQPKKMPLKNPRAAAQNRKDLSVGTSSQNAYWAQNRAARLTRQYERRRPRTCPIQPPSRLPTMPVRERA